MCHLQVQSHEARSNTQPEIITLQAFVCCVLVKHQTFAVRAKTDTI